MKICFENTLSAGERRALLKRPAQNRPDVQANVGNLCINIKQRGDAAVREYIEKFDGINIQDFRVPPEECEKAQNALPENIVDAFNIAAKNIRTFHESQKTDPRRISTAGGIVCWREPRPIERVGLYIPAGSAPLPSTVLMLGIPAKIAGCPKIILCSPPRVNGSIDPIVLGIASMIGINEIYRIGGAQAIAAMAYGTETVQKVDKIFGPGNRFVTAAKQFVSTDPDGAAIDLLAGPSEVLIIADDSALPDVVAFDLISQAEHDNDAQAVLVTPSRKLAEEVQENLLQSIKEFSRGKYIENALNNSFILITESLKEAIKFSNEYAPEHLIINTKDPENIVPEIINAGSVFVGPFAPVTAGDYASGTNHTLPTGGTARYSNGVTLDSYLKYITFQSITSSGLEGLAPVLTAFADAEGLQAHARAVTSRLSPKRDK